MSSELIGQHLRVFLCHSTGDKPAVRELSSKLRADGFDPWLDEEKLLPGQDWKFEIEKAVHEIDVVIVCLSRASVNKNGFVHKESLFASPVGAVATIPVVPTGGWQEQYCRQSRRCRFAAAGGRAVGPVCAREIGGSVSDRLVARISSILTLRWLGEAVCNNHQELLCNW